MPPYSQSAAAAFQEAQLPVLDWSDPNPVEKLEIGLVSQDQLVAPSELQTAAEAVAVSVLPAAPAVDVTAGSSSSSTSSSDAQIVPAELQAPAAAVGLAAEPAAVPVAGGISATPFDVAAEAPDLFAGSSSSSVLGSSSSYDSMHSSNQATPGDIQAQNTAAPPIEYIVTQPVTQYVTEPVTQYVTEPVTQYVTEPVTQYVTEPIAASSSAADVESFWLNVLGMEGSSDPERAAAAAAAQQALEEVRAEMMMHQQQQQQQLQQQPDEQHYYLEQQQQLYDQQQQQQPAADSIDLVSTPEPAAVSDTFWMNVPTSYADELIAVEDPIMQQHWSPEAAGLEQQQQQQVLNDLMVASPPQDMTGLPVEDQQTPASVIISTPALPDAPEGLTAVEMWPAPQPMLQPTEQQQQQQQQISNSATAVKDSSAYLPRQLRPGRSNMVNPPPAAAAAAAAAQHETAAMAALPAVPDLPAFTEPYHVKVPVVTYSNAPAAAASSNPGQATYVATPVDASSADPVAAATAPAAAGTPVNQMVFDLTDVGVEPWNHQQQQQQDWSASMGSIMATMQPKLPSVVQQQAAATSANMKQAQAAQPAAASPAKYGAAAATAPVPAGTATKAPAAAGGSKSASSISPAAAAAAALPRRAGKERPPAAAPAAATVAVIPAPAPIAAAAASVQSPFKYGNYITLFNYNTNSKNAKNPQQAAAAVAVAAAAEQLRQQQRDSQSKSGQKTEPNAGKKQQAAQNVGIAAVSALKEVALSAAPAKNTQQQQQSEATLGKSGSTPQLSSADDLNVLIDGHLGIENPWGSTSGGASSAAQSSDGSSSSSGSSTSSWRRLGLSNLATLTSRRP
jgi:hypothetical protein